MLHTIYYVDLKSARLAHSTARIGSGWATHAERILRTQLDGIKKHWPGVDVLLLTDTTSPSFGIETLRMRPNPGEGIMDFRYRLLCSLAGEEPFTHADADIAVCGPLDTLRPASGSDVGTHKGGNSYAPVAHCPESMLPFPKWALHPERPDYVNLRAILPYDTAFVWVNSSRYLRSLQAANDTVRESLEMRCWWGDLAAHTLAITRDHLRVHVYPDSVVGYAGDHGQTVVLQKGPKTAEAIEAFAIGTANGTQKSTRRYATPAEWPTRQRITAVKDIDDVGE
jgi:hypothetical protein